MTNKSLKQEIKRLTEAFLDMKTAEAEDLESASKDFVLRIKKLVEKNEDYKAAEYLVSLYKKLGGKNDKEILKLAISLVLLPLYLEIHKDLWKKDNIITANYKNLYKKDKKKKSQHLGNSVGIVAGDVSTTLAYQVILESKFSKEEKIKLMKEINIFLENELKAYTDSIVNNRSNIKNTDFKILANKLIVTLLGASDHKVLIKTGF
ncbi:MAG: hypothetical protein ABIE68_01795 [bacterium]